MPDLYLGIDIGGTKIAGAIVSGDGAMREAITLPTDARLGRDHILATALLAATTLLESDLSVTGIGIGTGGQIDPVRGVVVTATDILPGWGGTDLRAVFERRFDIPTAVDNDVNALAVGEVRFGAARGLKTVVFVALGTGVGGALVIDGALHRGAHWSGGEFGHLLIEMAPTARQDAGGGRGTLEAYCSGRGLVETYCEIAGSPGARITGTEIARLSAESPNGPAALAIARTGSALGFGLASIANILDPDIIVIGGGLAALGEQLLAPARLTLRERALPGPAQCPVVTASLGDHASVIGAACLAMRS